MTHSDPLPRRAALLATRLMLMWLRRAERQVSRTARTLDATRFEQPRLTLNIVNDPTGSMRLIGVRGPLTHATVTGLATALASVDDGSVLHLDVTDAEITGHQVLEQIELLVDRLEFRGVRIRIVGLDPRHPALSYQPRR